MKPLGAAVGKVFMVGGWAPLLVFTVHVFISRVLGAYHTFPATDMPMHFGGGLAMAFFISRCFRALPRDVVRSSRLVLLELILVGSLTATSAVLWECAEFMCDQVFGSNIQRSLGNTMQDLALGVAGAAVFIIVRARALRAGRREVHAVVAEWMTGLKAPDPACR
jgi:hypothetical protein